MVYYFPKIELRLIEDLAAKFGAEVKPKSKALFVFYQKGKIVGEVQGTNAPAILGRRSISAAGVCCSGAAGVCSGGGNTK